MHSARLHNTPWHAQHTPCSPPSGRPGGVQIPWAEFWCNAPMPCTALKAHVCAYTPMQTYAQAVLIPAQRRRWHRTCGAFSASFSHTSHACPAISRWGEPNYSPQHWSGPLGCALWRRGKAAAVAIADALCCCAFWWGNAIGVMGVCTAAQHRNAAAGNAMRLTAAMRRLITCRRSGWRTRSRLGE